DHHRGWPPAVDRLPGDAHLRRGHARERHLDHVLARARDLRRARRDPDHRPTGDVETLALRGRPGGRGAVRPRHGATGGGSMTLANAVAVVLVVGVTMYAVFGGADFGAGLWSLLAGGGEGGRRPRALIDWALGPVWEANHVWLIFVLVVLWTGFPSAFESIFSTLFIPLSLAAFGIVLRGAGFAFQHTARRVRGRVLATTVFGASSVLTPFFVGTGAYLSSVFLVSDARRAGTPDLERYFTDRAIVAAVVTGALAAVGLVALHADARAVFDGLK